MSAPTGGEITVHRCAVRVVRRGGWSWGPDPRGLVQRVLDALPDLLAAEFGEHLTGDGPDLEITEPVRLSVRLAARGGGALVPANLVLDRAASADPLSAPVPTPVPVPAPGPAGPSVEPSTTDPATELPVLAADVPAPTVAALFEELTARDELTALLALLPEETVRRYLAALLAEDAGEPADPGTPGPVAELARRLALPGPPVTRAELLELLGSPRGETGEQTGSAAAVGESASSGVTAVPRPAGETRVGSVLPFLLAGPLARTGYLDVIGPALSGVDLPGDAPLFAAALAYQVLGEPQRGWRRTPEDDLAAATFAGLESVPDLTTFARRAGPALPVLDGVLALSLCRGHEPGAPLLVAGVDDGLLLVDTPGLYPMAWVSTVEGLLPHWAACGRPPVLVRDGPLPPACLRELAAAGVRFLTDARPLRDDPLTRLRSRTPLWTTGGVEPRLAAGLPAEQLDELTRTLFAGHRALPLAGDHALDHSTALAASLALGVIAGQLWGGDTPVLTLTRFADLEATVRFERDAVRVKIPLGRRHADLWRGGALADVPNVVWLGGRTLTFSGG
ncbi:hypothetical protein Amsp01_060610 [Amycolatopsis sp. NBRC 101858]|uniref:hypothetical protein n=1 Tax=Amycolatopsis sp. NBRC 101858 TaxID=3032200 RepID=UPI0024A467B2|nr:hypothetical protein [Amycolatopsis sp. NBRC 101858]GLY40038.1 hypothetical protein Amsp01_060610 [Amycolatopsis sp. NBRC 101858]